MYSNPDIGVLCLYQLRECNRQRILALQKNSHGIFFVNVSNSLIDGVVTHNNDATGDIPQELHQYHPAGCAQRLRTSTLNSGILLDQTTNSTQPL